ncbi:MAG: ribonuclease HI [Parcubacteria group bacterium Licking1014_17]|nr:MAG: ribonuclease HI [Parcubacteria group bacterium Licking1014_17]
MNNKYIIHVDGGSRGNPGPAAIGAVIALADGSLKKEYGEFIGQATNNEAEYQAAIFALKKLKLLVGKEKARNARVEVHMDSEFMAKQINGEYKVEEPDIQKLFLELWNLKIGFKNISFIHLTRDKNKAADKLVNVALDRETRKLL